MDYAHQQIYYTYKSIKLLHATIFFHICGNLILSGSYKYYSFFFFFFPEKGTKFGESTLQFRVSPLYCTKYVYWILQDLMAPSISGRLVVDMQIPPLLLFNLKVWIF